MIAALADTRVAVAQAGRSARAAWRPSHTAAALVAVLVLLLPWWAPGFVEIDTLAGWAYLALAAEGLWLAAGLAGMPSLGQGAFMSIGAFTTALLTARSGWPAEATVPVATAVALAAGLAIGATVVRLPRLYIAVSTWILTWLVVLLATEFPGISGGAQGYVVTSSLDPTGHYVLAVALTILLVVAGTTLQRSSVGLRLRALRDHPAAAVRLGVPRERLLLGAFAASAAVGGLAGSLAVQLAGVSDPNEFGPFTAFKLLVAVLLGGAAFAGSGPVGILIVGAIALVVRAWSAAGGQASAQLEPLLAAVLLLLVLGLGSDGLLPAVSRAVERYRPGRRKPEEPSTRFVRRRRPAELSARGLRKSFGGVHALDGLDLHVEPGECVAIVGANGSGKTTALRALCGMMDVDRGAILLDGRSPPGPAPHAWVDAGIVCTLQGTAVFRSLTALESALVGAGVHRRFAGPFRALASTPRSRREAAEARARSLETLRFVGLEDAVDEPAERLDSHRQRLLMLASALTAEPRVLLLDEPSAGATAGEAVRLGAVVTEIKRLGISLVVVEHNLRLVSSVADRVVVMAEGRAVADGSPEALAAAP
jgi:ABC-type branched-subunit amino acid transport system ATPase component/ABC-type branched-subunit amino acid transport system permease subunit